MKRTEDVTAKSLVGLVNDLNNSQLLALTDSANRRALKKFLNGSRALINFVVADHFKVDTSDQAEVKISYLSGDFREQFLGKTEEMSDLVLPRHHHDLKKDSLDEEILNDLGGADKAEVTLAGVYELMKLQSHGEDGALLTNGYANIFYVKDAGGVLRAVGVAWRGDGWGVGARSVGAPRGWLAGRRVFSRNS